MVVQLFVTLALIISLTGLLVSIILLLRYVTGMQIIK